MLEVTIRCQPKWCHRINRGPTMHSPDCFVPTSPGNPCPWIWLLEAEQFHCHKLKPWSWHSPLSLHDTDTEVLSYLGQSHIPGRHCRLEFWPRWQHRCACTWCCTSPGYVLAIPTMNHLCSHWPCWCTLTRGVWSTWFDPITALVKESLHVLLAYSREIVSKPCPKDGVYNILQPRMSERKPLISTCNQVLDHNFLLFLVQQLPVCRIFQPASPPFGPLKDEIVRELDFMASLLEVTVPQHFCNCSGRQSGVVWFLQLSQIEHSTLIDEIILLLRKVTSLLGDGNSFVGHGRV